MSSSTANQNGKHDVISKGESKELSKFELHHDEMQDISLVKPLAFELCKQYLGGAWKHIDYSDFEITRIIGGLTNFIYLCEIDQKFKRESREPHKIVLKLYGRKRDYESILKFLVASTIISTTSLGPRIYGLTKQGQLEEFIEYPKLNHDAETMVKCNQSTARAVARFHSLDIPVSKEPDWIFNFLNELIEQSKTVRPKNQSDMEKYQKFKSFNLENEIKNIKKIIDLLDSPVVYSHNDLSPDNILDTPERVTIIDYEFSAYNYRGFDLGCYFGKWMLNTNITTSPYYSYDRKCRLTREKQVEFIEAYLDELTMAIKEKFDAIEKRDGTSSALQHTLDSLNLNVERIVTESNYFELVSHLIFGLLALSNYHKSEMYKFDFLDYALARCEAYFDQKKVLFPNDFDSFRV